jgi:hypothetical protein
MKLSIKLNAPLVAAAVFASALSIGLAAPAAKAATLLGNGTFQVANDLTRIDNSGTVLEFLDLPTTLGQTEAAALATFGPAGFTLATATQVSALFDAFGIVYNLVPGTFVDLGASASARASFISFLGITISNPGQASLGDFDSSGSGIGTRSYFCISTGARCAPDSFVNNRDATPDFQIGITLVRTNGEDMNPVPLPTALPLFATGLGALGLLGWHRKRKAVV